MLLFPPGWDVAREHRNETGNEENLVFYLWDCREARICLGGGQRTGHLASSGVGSNRRAALLWPVWMSPVLLEWRKQVLELPSFEEEAELGPSAGHFSRQCLCAPEPGPSDPQEPWQLEYMGVSCAHMCVFSSLISAPRRSRMAAGSSLGLHAFMVISGKKDPFVPMSQAEVLSLH